MTYEECRLEAEVHQEGNQKVEEEASVQAVLMKKVSTRVTLIRYTFN